ncbi:MAG: hypothetical protein IH585_15470 [Anaerolineaceae bacterium]|nr:hypothetical protein [Anaerolineaceae bacterium]
MYPIMTGKHYPTMGGKNNPAIDKLGNRNISLVGGGRSLDACKQRAFDSLNPINKYLIERSSPLCSHFR